MFIIKKGIVAISSEASGSVARLTGGDHFGEVALVMHTKRVASAQAVNYVLCYVLEAADLQAVLEKYPDVRARVLQSAHRKRRAEAENPEDLFELSHSEDEDDYDDDDYEDDEYENDEDEDDDNGEADEDHGEHDETEEGSSPHADDDDDATGDTTTSAQAGGHQRSGTMLGGSDDDEEDESADSQGSRL